MQAVWKTLKAFGADKKRLNGKLGMTSVLHTWGQNLSQHVHLHCLIPGGALGEDQQWHSAKSSYLFPVRALSRHYRGNLVSALRKCAKAGKLSRISNVGEVDTVLNALMKKGWVVYSKHCLNHTDSIIGMDNDRVRFSYKDYQKNQSGIMALHYDEFIRRFLMHVLPKGLMRIRHYGILANRCRQASIKIIRRLLATPAPVNRESTENEPVTYPCPECRQGHLIPKSKLSPIPLAHPLPS